MLNDNEREMYERWGKNPPTHIPHGEPDDIEKNLKAPITREWRQEGNTLLCKTDLGEIAQIIPTDMMLVGTDKKGLPILKKMVL